MRRRSILVAVAATISAMSLGGCGVLGNEDPEAKVRFSRGTTTTTSDRPDGPNGPEFDLGEGVTVVTRPDGSVVRTADGSPVTILTYPTDPAAPAPSTTGVPVTMPDGTPVTAPDGSPVTIAPPPTTRPGTPTTRPRPTTTLRPTTTTEDPRTNLPVCVDLRDVVGRGTLLANLAPTAPVSAFQSAAASLEQSLISLRDQVALLGQPSRLSVVGQVAVWVGQLRAQLGQMADGADAADAVDGFFAQVLVPSIIEGVNDAARATCPPVEG